MKSLQDISLTHVLPWFLRLITEKVTLSQEIVQCMSKSNIGGNIVIKLDMAKPYNIMD